MIQRFGSAEKIANVVLVRTFEMENPCLKRVVIQTRQQSDVSQVNCLVNGVKVAPEVVLEQTAGDDCQTAPDLCMSHNLFYNHFTISYPVWSAQTPPERSL